MPKSLAEVLGLDPVALSNISKANKKELAEWIKAIRLNDQELLTPPTNPDQSQLEKFQQTKMQWEKFKQELVEVEKTLSSWKPVLGGTLKQMTAQLKQIAGWVANALGDGGQNRPPEIVLKSAQEKEEALQKKLDELIFDIDQYKKFVIGSMIYNEDTVTTERQLELERALSKRIDEIDLLKSKAEAVTLEKLDDLPVVEQEVKDLYKFKFESELQGELGGKVFTAETLMKELTPLKDKNIQKPYPWRQTEVLRLITKLEECHSTLASGTKTQEEKTIASNLAKMNLVQLASILTQINVPLELPNKTLADTALLKDNIAKLRLGADQVIKAFEQEKDFIQVKTVVGQAIAEAVRPLEAVARIIEGTTKLYEDCKDVASEAFLSANVQKLPGLIDNCITSIATNNVLRVWKNNKFAAETESVNNINKALTNLKTKITQ